MRFVGKKDLIQNISSENSVVSNKDLGAIKSGLSKQDLKDQWMTAFNKIMRESLQQNSLGNLSKAINAAFINSNFVETL